MEDNFFSPYGEQGKSTSVKTDRSIYNLKAGTDVLHPTHVQYKHKQKINCHITSFKSPFPFTSIKGTKQVPYL